MEARMASVTYVMITFFQHLDPKGSGEGPSNIRLRLASSRKSWFISYEMNRKLTKVNFIVML